MTVILSKENENSRLDPQLSEESMERLMQPFDPDKMEAYIIKNEFIKKTPQGKSVVEKAS
jgi:hypothetical protein